MSPHRTCHPACYSVSPRYFEELQHAFHTAETRTAHHIEKEASAMLNILGHSPLLTEWLCCVYCTPKCSLPFDCQAWCWLLLSWCYWYPQVPSCCAALEALVSHLCLHLALLCPMCRTWHFSSLNFVVLMIVQYSAVSRSICRVSCPSRESTVPFSLVNLLRHSIHASRSELCETALPITLTLAFWNTTVNV